VSENIGDIAGKMAETQKTKGSNRSRSPGHLVFAFQPSNQHVPTQHKYIIGMPLEYSTSIQQPGINF